VSQKSIGIIARITCGFIFMAAVSHLWSFPPAHAGAILKGDLLNIRTPNSDGWVLIRSDSRFVEFGRHDETNGDTYVAVVSSFPIKGNPSYDEFVSTVKEGIEKDTSHRRFKNIIATFKPISDRPYKCVRYESSAEDRGVKNGAAGVPYFLYIRSLYCQHPIKPNLGFMISYSQRGGPLNPSLDKDAESFFDGVEVPSGTAQ
jgi:hypothetical protein